MSWYRHTILPTLLNSAMGSQRFEAIRPEVISQARGLVLEIGVGAGHNLPLYKNVTKVFALEPFEQLAAIARTRSTAVPVEFLEAPAERIPLPDSSIDTVISTWTLCSVGNPKEVLFEIKRVLKREGRFVFVDHGASPNRFVRTLQKMLTPLTKRFTGNCHMDRDIEGLMKEAGICIERKIHLKEPWKPLMFNTQGSGRVC